MAAAPVNWPLARLAALSNAARRREARAPLLVLRQHLDHILVERARVHRADGLGRALRALAVAEDVVVAELADHCIGTTVRAAPEVAW